jgi:hypothetical protein
MDTGLNIFVFHDLHVVDRTVFVEHVVVVIYKHLAEGHTVM